MKKLFVMLLTLTILAVPVTAYGGEDTIGKNENRSIDVQAKYANGTDTPDVYSKRCMGSNAIYLFCRRYQSVGSF